MFVNFIVFFVAVARAVANHDDGSGTAPDPLVWSAGSLPKRPSVLHAVRDFAFLPGPVGIWDGGWVSFGVSGITAEDVIVWPYSVSLLVKVSAFSGTLHWPTGAVDFGVGGVSFVEMLILYELWAGERLCLESATLRHPRVSHFGSSVPLFASPVEEWTLAGNPWLHAQRRKLRRLRAALRHEQQSIAMAPGVSTSPLSRQDDQGPVQRPTGTGERWHRVLRTF